MANDPKPQPNASDGTASGARDGKERIAKVMARAGLASRRGAEAIIEQGRVTLNGKKLDTPAVTVGPGDDIRVDGKPLPRAEPTRLWRYHKPPGLLTTNRDDDGRPTIFDRLPDSIPRVITVGRLDMNTEGLLLLTNDGELARYLELPDTGWLRRYRVRAYGKIDQPKLDTLASGPRVEGVKYGPVIAKIERETGDNVWLNVDLREGKNREVKRVLSSVGLEVNRLIRVSYGPFTLEQMARGEVAEVPRRILKEQIPDRFRNLGETGGGRVRSGNSSAANKASVSPAKNSPAKTKSRRKGRSDAEFRDGFGVQSERSVKSSRSKSGKANTASSRKPSSAKPATGKAFSQAKGKPSKNSKGPSGNKGVKRGPNQGGSDANRRR